MVPGVGAVASVVGGGRMARVGVGGPGVVRMGRMAGTTQPLPLRARVRPSITTASNRRNMAQGYSTTRTSGISRANA